MILLLFLIFGLIIGMLRGGGLSGLAGMKLHWLWLLIVAALAEAARILLPVYSAAPYSQFLPAIQIARFAPLILFCIINVRNWRICIAALGLIANFLVIYMNGWQMPIAWFANDIPGFADKVKHVMDGLVPGYTLMQQAYSANLWYLADMLPLIRPEIGFASIGDILLGFGVLLAVQNGMANYSYGKHVRGGKARRVEKRKTVSRRISEMQPLPAAPSEPFASEPSPEPAEPVPSSAPLAPEQVHEEESAPMPAPEPAMPRDVEPPEPAPARKGKEPLVKKQKPEKRKRGKEASSPEENVDHPLLDTLPDSMYAPEDEEPEAYGAASGLKIKLSPRLEIVAFMAGRAATVADVGCDHGKLSAWMALNRSSKVIAMDISSKSLSKTKQLVKEFGLYSLVQTRVSDGLKKLKRGEADVIVISGLGGPTICSILEEGHDVASSAAKLVLQPMNAIGVVRRWLADNGYCITGEQLAEEDGRIYQVLSAVPGSDGCPPMSLFDLEVGHLLIDNRHPLLNKLLEYKIATIEKILSEIADIATPKAEARRSELIALRDRCSEVLEWLAAR